MILKPTSVNGLMNFPIIALRLIVAAKIGLFPEKTNFSSLFSKKSGKINLLSKSFCIFAGAIHMESKTYWLRISVQLSDSKSGNVGNSRIQLPEAILRTDGVNAHAIGVGSLILYCRRFLRPPD